MTLQEEKCIWIENPFQICSYPNSARSQTTNCFVVFSNVSHSFSSPSNRINKRESSSGVNALWCAYYTIHVCRGWNQISHLVITLSSCVRNSHSHCIRWVVPNEIQFSNANGIRFVWTFIKTAWISHELFSYRKLRENSSFTPSRDGEQALTLMEISHLNQIFFEINWITPILSI